MQVVDVGVGQQAVQRCINRSGRGVQAKSAEGVVAHHLVFMLNAAIELLESEQLFLVESGETCALNTAEIAAAPLDPQNLDDFAGQRIFLLHLGTCIAAAKVGDAQVRTQQIGAVTKEFGFIQVRSNACIPHVLEITQTFHSSSMYPADLSTSLIKMLQLVIPRAVCARGICFSLQFVE